MTILFVVSPVLKFPYFVDVFCHHVSIFLPHAEKGGNIYFKVKGLFSLL